MIERPTKIFDKDDFNDCEFLSHIIVIGIYVLALLMVILIGTEVFSIGLFLGLIGNTGLLIWIILLIRFKYRVWQYKNEQQLNHEVTDTEVVYADPPYSIMPNDWDVSIDRNQWFYDFDHVISDKPLIIDYNKIYNITKKQATIDPIAKELLDKFSEYKTEINRVVRKLRSRKKHAYWEQTWQYQYGEAMRKWLHGIGALQVKIEYVFDTQIAKFIYRNNQYLLSYHEKCGVDPRVAVNRRFHLSSKSSDFTCDIRFDDIRLIFQYLDGSRSFFGTDEVKGSLYPIFLGDGKINQGFEKI